MLKIAICDDNELQLDILSSMVSDYGRETGVPMKIVCYQNGRKLIDDLMMNTYDIYLLDMIMPDISGMDVARLLRSRKDKGQIIFVTASADYAIASYEVEALYYMLKPLNRDVLFKVLDKAIRIISCTGLDFSVKTPDGYALVKTRELIYVEAQGRSPIYHQTRGREVRGLVLRSSFSAATKGFLSTGFFAYLGPSKLINLKYVERMNDECVMLSDGTIIYGSKAACSSFHLDWESYLLQLTKPTM